MDHQPGDKLRIKQGKNAGSRAVVSDVGERKLFAMLENGGGQITVDPEDVQNYSLAARKAWQSMPSRRVGRPVGTKRTDRVVVNLRFEHELWSRFKKAEEEGLVGDRIAFVNRALRNALDELLPLGRKD